ncbi:MAG: type II/IV secretion system protein [Candidatus Zambryskibacteria bacterium]|nr:type II/IV secretion system protein [Candidatus Zambryskibacteria bacterium]
MTILFNEDKQRQKVEELREQEEEGLAKMMAQKYGLPYKDFSISSVNIDALRIVKEIEAREAGAAPFNLINKKLSLAILTPNANKTQELVEELKDKGYTVNLFLVSQQSLEKIWERYKDLSYSLETKSGALDISNEDIEELTASVKNVTDIKKSIENLISQKKNYRISRILEIILAGAISVEASDIHIEPEDSSVRIRFRLDGVLNNVTEIDSRTYNLLLSRIKLVSNLKLNVKGKAQDGRFSIKLADEEIEIRTSLLPGGYGESIVLRVLNPNAISVPLEELGINERLLEILKHEMSKPNGMILNTGPTGSGKTTTLYAFLKKRHTPGIKIITIENPIEYHIKGIVQTQTDDTKGYTFLEGLRSALRQDPDIIMVGEIRDQETAEIAINASLTGHLVFSTLHTNNAAGTFPRLIDLGVNPKVISSAMNIAMAQRLVRKLCDKCKKKASLNDSEKIIIKNTLNTIKDKKYLEELDIENVYEPTGCEICNFTGYKGRTGIFEAILADEEIEKIVTENPSEREINKAAEGQNILSMKQDGIIKVLKGVTSLSELSRVIDLEE